jgi:osmotically-inducible protein OsmY
MKNNEELQKDVQDAIKWEPLLHAAQIGVTVNDGIVTLTGIVDSYSKKAEAEAAAKNIAGVKAVVEKIEIKFNDTWAPKNDNDIAAEIISALSWNWQVPNDKVRIKVEKGWVTLEGELQWNYQKDAAAHAVKHLLGVTGLSNNITIKSESQDQVEKTGIEKALKRNWSLDDRKIKVKVSGNAVTLTGTVNSWYQKDESSEIAWNAPGVSTVTNELVVECR